MWKTFHEYFRQREISKAKSIFQMFITGIKKVVFYLFMTV